jgi:hypothetical protein
MTVMLADYNPGTLSGFYFLLLAGLGVVFCLALAGVLALCKARRVARGFLIAAGVIFCAGILFACLAVALGKRLHLV